jgi:hypothetical protein
LFCFYWEGKEEAKKKPHKEENEIFLCF